MKLLKSLIYEEKRSRFLAFLYTIETEDEAKTIEDDLRAEHPKACHLLKVLRYQNRFGVYVSLASEDKEPVSSMKKTRDLMERKDIRDIGIFIVRYFGGTKLGASRLDHVYFSLAAKLMAEVANEKKKQV